MLLKIGGLLAIVATALSAQTPTQIDWGQIRGPFPYVGGSDQQIQYSNMGVLAGSPNLSYNYATSVFTLIGEGQFKNGIVACGGTTCPPYDPYGISVAINTSFNPWAVDGVAGLGDTTIIDYIGMEGVFFRIKGYDISNGGDYFDWTRGNATNTGVLPQHQIRLADSSGEDIQYYTGATYPNGVNAFSGVLGFGLCHSATVSCTGYAVDVGLSRTVGVTNTLEVNTTVPGTLAQFKALGLLVNQANDSSGYQIQSNGGIEMTNTSDNIISKGTAPNAISATAGGINAATIYSVGSTTIADSTSAIVVGGTLTCTGGQHLAAVTVSTRGAPTGTCN
jgi:hypothetical protein